ncbi:hypothetical protein [Angelakisella massiliensis]|uniref:hypothetical protein n=1 Tax=Angelakisella massiliensis TaxID=1871018 RepID=UPI0024B12800|nr:hypothetical protein [Angelakisella massiliensis]
MVKLTHPLFWEGRLHDVGKMMALPAALEAEMIRNQTAISVGAVDDSPQVPPVMPEGDVSGEKMDTVPIPEAEQLPLGRSLTK